MHLYIHVPFCARRCSYCDFAIAVRRRVPGEIFRDVVLTEWRRALADPRTPSLQPMETIYFGGGTPSLVGAEILAAILDGIRAERAVAPDVEITIEANPEDVTGALAEQLARAGVNRVSLGVQSFDAGVLQWMHRVHGPEQARTAVDALRAAGIQNLSLDLIYGVPASLRRNWTADMDRALALEPTHLSFYGLTVEQRTPLGRWVDRGSAVPADDGAAAAEFLAAHRQLVTAGFRHYEVSNAARPGFESRHNRSYWRRTGYLGLGPSAHSATAGRRWWNIREWEPYRAAVAEGRPSLAGEEDLTAEQVALEDLYLGLRTDAGRPASSLPVDEVSRWLAAGWAGRNGRHIVLTAEGWLRLDALVSRVAGT